MHKVSIRGMLAFWVARNRPRGMLARRVDWWHRVGVMVGEASGRTVSTSPHDNSNRQAHTAAIAPTTSAVRHAATVCRACLIPTTPK